MIRADMPWQKSSFSEANGACLEISSRGGHLLVRESDEPGTIVRIRTEMLRVLFENVKSGALKAE